MLNNERENGIYLKGFYLKINVIKQNIFFKQTPINTVYTNIKKIFNKSVFWLKLTICF